MSHQVISKIKDKAIKAENIKQIPNFSFTTLNNLPFTEKELSINKATLFIYFNSECDYCNHEAEMVQQHAEKLKDIQVVFVSHEPLEDIKAFATKYKLLNHDTIYFLYDPKATFTTSFDVNTLPCLILYNKQRKLIEKFKGQVKMETILKKLNN